MLRELRDAQAVGPEHRTLVGDDELEVREAAHLELQHVRRPRHRERDVARRERVDVVLPEVLADDAVVSLLRELVRRRLPVVLGRLARLHAHPQQREVRHVLGVAEHAHLPFERRVEQVQHARDLSPRELRVVADPRDPRHVRDREPIPGVVGRVLVFRSSVRREVRQLGVVERDQVVVRHHQRQPLGEAHDDQVVAGGLLRLEQYVQFREELVVGLDHLDVVDVDVRLLGEQLERRIDLLPVDLGTIDVERPVRERERAGDLLGCPVERAGRSCGPGGTRRSRAGGRRLLGPAARRQQPGEAQPGGAHPGRAQEPATRHPRMQHPPQQGQVPFVVIRHPAASLARREQATLHRTERARPTGRNT